MTVVHQTDHSPDTLLAEYKRRIIDEVDGVALRVGRLLREAKAVNPDTFDTWVETELPFGSETARRLIAISAAYEKLPEDAVRQLPRPWQAMYAIKELPPHAIISGIADGAIGPSMTVRQAIQYARKFRDKPSPAKPVSHIGVADKLAGSLMLFTPDDLTSPVLDALREWINPGLVISGGI